MWGGTATEGCPGGVCPDPDGGNRPTCSDNSAKAHWCPRALYGLHLGAGLGTKKEDARFLPAPSVHRCQLGVGRLWRCVVPWALLWEPRGQATVPPALTTPQARIGAPRPAVPPSPSRPPIHPGARGGCSARTMRHPRWALAHDCRLFRRNVSLQAKKTCGRRNPTVPGGFFLRRDSVGAGESG